MCSLVHIHSDITSNVSYKNESHLYDDFIFVNFTINDEIYYCEITDEAHVKIYTESNDFTKIINNIIKYIPSILSPRSVPAFIINQFIDQIIEIVELSSAGFDEMSDSDNDYNCKDLIQFWKNLQSSSNINRNINITSFGNKYKGFESTKNSFDISFNALCVRSKMKKGMNLSKLRGTDVEVQQIVNRGKGFCDFITHIVHKIETHNYTNIGIFCRAGHHRSVSCVELLKKHIYKKAHVNHLNLK